MTELDAMIAETRQDRRYFRQRFLETGNHGFSIEAAACAIREKALLDARERLFGRRA